MGGVLDFEFGEVPGQTGAVDVIKVEAPLRFYTGRQVDHAVAEPCFISIGLENVSSSFLRLDELDLDQPDTIEFGRQTLVSSALTVTEEPAATDELSVQRAELVSVIFQSENTFDVWGSRSGWKLRNQEYVSGEPIVIEGVQFTLSGPAAAGDTFVYEITRPPLLGRVKQALEDVVWQRAIVGSTSREVGSATVLNEQTLIELAGRTSQIEDVDYAEELAVLIREQVLGGTSIISVGQVLDARTDLVMQLLSVTVLSDTRLE